MDTNERTISLIKEGTVVDHIPSDVTFKVAQILNLEDYTNVLTIGTNLGSKKQGKKGIIKIEGKLLTKKEADQISIIAPNATVSIIEDYKVKDKIKLTMPKRFENIIKCNNPNCITNKEKMRTLFLLAGENPTKIRCVYCERSFKTQEVELK